MTKQKFFAQLLGVVIGRLISDIISNELHKRRRDKERARLRTEFEKAVGKGPSIIYRQD